MILIVHLLSCWSSNLRLWKHASRIKKTVLLVLGAFCHPQIYIFITSIQLLFFITELTESLVNICHFKAPVHKIIYFFIKLPFQVVAQSYFILESMQLLLFVILLHFKYQLLLPAVVGTATTAEAQSRAMLTAALRCAATFYYSQSKKSFHSIKQPETSFY